MDLQCLEGEILEDHAYFATPSDDFNLLVLGDVESSINSLNQCIPATHQIIADRGDLFFDAVAFDEFVTVNIWISRSPNIMKVLVDQFASGQCCKVFVLSHDSEFSNYALHKLSKSEGVEFGIVHLQDNITKPEFGGTDSLNAGCFPLVVRDGQIESFRVVFDTIYDFFDKSFLDIPESFAGLSPPAVETESLVVTEGHENNEQDESLTSNDQREDEMEENELTLQAVLESIYHS